MTQHGLPKSFAARLLIGFFFCSLATACQAPEPTGPAGKWTDLTPSESRLSLPIQELKSAPRRALFRSDDGRYSEEVAEWGHNRDEAGAGLWLSEASPGPAQNDPQGPKGIIALWPALQDMTPGFSDPHTDRNDLGPVTWWRASLGTTVCVLFAQRLPRPDPGAATLSGYFCNPQGLPMPPDAAATVVRSIGLRAAPKAQ
jgi:hypothetical protein